MDMETISGLLLTKVQVENIFTEMTVAYRTPTNLCTSSPALPTFSKLGVLIDIDDIAEARKTKNPICEKNKSNKKLPLLQNYCCIQCRRLLPTAHLLDLHITEQHDLYFAASVERGDKPQYPCYIEECDLKFYVPKERKHHCITMHKFPANYRFDQEKVVKVRKRIDASAVHVEVKEWPPSNEANLPYIKAFTFGHPTERTFCTPKESGSGKALHDVQTLKNALNEID